MNVHLRACVQSVHHHHTQMISDSRAAGQSQRRQRPVQSQTTFASSGFAGRRRHESLFRTRITA